MLVLGFEKKSDFSINGENATCHVKPLFLGQSLLGSFCFLETLHFGGNTIYGSLSSEI
jgi:hypothetical protein